MKTEIEQIVTWLRKKVSSAHAKGLLVGVSGGLDSAVVAHLIQRAYPENSLGVIMPLQTSKEDVADAQSVIESSQIQSMTIDLTETHNILYGTIQDNLKATNTLNENMDQLADANLRARLRMSTLYTLAANYNYLVTGTDNKSNGIQGTLQNMVMVGLTFSRLLNLRKQKLF